MTRTLLCVLLLSAAPAHAEEIVLYGAGSLRAVVTAITAEYTKKMGIAVRTAFGPSGLMREKIEAGDKVDLFASADMGHALKLRKEGRAVEVVMFTRNRLCAFAKPEARLTSAGFADRLLDSAVKLGTSTPKADPAGDYTWTMFGLIDKARPGAFATLEAKAQKIEGGTTTPDPARPDPVAAGFASGEINVMIGYCSGTEQRRKATPDLEVIAIPDEYAAGPEYGMAIISFEKPASVALAFAILSPEGQATLKQFGFAPVGLQSKP